MGVYGFEVSGLGASGLGYKNYGSGLLGFASVGLKV